MLQGVLQECSRVFRECSRNDLQKELVRFLVSQRCERLDLRIGQVLESFHIYALSVYISRAKK